MDNLFILTEKDFKNWAKEVMQECLNEYLKQPSSEKPEDNHLLNRKEIAAFLRISLVTLTDWVKRGLPSHHQRGRVYFDKGEVLNYIKDKKLRQLKLGSKLHHVKMETG